jgi:hypothetical protein
MHIKSAIRILVLNCAHLVGTLRQARRGVSEKRTSLLSLIFENRTYIASLEGLEPFPVPLRAHCLLLFAIFEKLASTLIK